MPFLSGRIRRRSFPGGAYLASERTPPADAPIRVIERPAVLIVPLVQHAGAPADAVVEVGRTVVAGELIGKASRPGAMDIHSPVAGQVIRRVRAVTAQHVDVPAIEIRAHDGAEAGTSEPAIASDRLAAARDGTSPRETGSHDAESLARAADGAGIVNCRRPAVALGDELRAAARSGIVDVIVNGMPQEPLVVSGSELLRRDAEEVVRASLLLCEALRARHVWLAVDEGDRDLTARCRDASRRTPARVVALPSKYPQAAPVLLAWAITGRETPVGRRPEDVHCLVIEVEALRALAEAAATGRPMVERLVNVAGPAVARPGLYRVAVGTKVAEVLRQVGLARSVAQVVEGGPLTGTALETTEAVVTRQTAALLVVDHEHERVPAPGPCIRCGWCQDGCPVGLDPQALLDAVERGDKAAAGWLHPGACLGCGLCSYVCPAELPLAQAATRLKFMAEQGGDGDKERGG